MLVCWMFLSLGDNRELKALHVPEALWFIFTESSWTPRQPIILVYFIIEIGNSV